MDLRSFSRRRRCVSRAEDGLLLLVGEVEDVAAHRGCAASGGETQRDFPGGRSCIHSPGGGTVVLFLHELQL